MTSLDDYLDAALRKGWRWGDMDCVCFGGDWVAAATQRDPLASYRGRYGTARGAARLIKANGGLVAMIDAAMARCGFGRREGEAEHGDVAVLPMPDASGEMAVARASVVIRCGHWWLGRGLADVVGLTAEPSAIWRVLP